MAGPSPPRLMTLLRSNFVQQAASLIRAAALSRTLRSCDGWHPGNLTRTRSRTLTRTRARARARTRARTRALSLTLTLTLTLTPERCREEEDLRLLKQKLPVSPEGLLAKAEVLEHA